MFRKQKRRKQSEKFRYLFGNIRCEEFSPIFYSISCNFLLLSSPSKMPWWKKRVNWKITVEKGKGFQSPSGFIRWMLSMRCLEKNFIHIHSDAVYCSKFNGSEFKLNAICRHRSRALKSHPHTKFFALKLQNIPVHKTYKTSPHMDGVRRIFFSVESL